MTATPIPTAHPPDGEWRRNGHIVLAAAIGAALGGQHFHIIGLMIRPLQEAYGWQRGEVALGLTVITVIHVLASIAMGTWVDRRPVRRIVLIGSVAFAAGFSCLGLAGPSLITWYAACAALALLSQGVTPVVWTAGVVRSFHRHRGLALALVLAGGGLTLAAGPTIVLWLLEHVGLRGTFPTLGLISGALILITSWCLMRGPAIEQSPIEPTGSGTAPTNRIAHLKTALRSQAFLLLMPAVLLIAAAASTFMVHLQPLLMDAGLRPQEAASIAWFLGPSVIGGRLLIGWLFDRFDVRMVACMAFLLPALASLALMTPRMDWSTAVVAAVLAGLCLGAEVDVLSYLTSRYFGVRVYGTLFAVLGGAYGIGVGIGSAAAGHVFDIFKSYHPWLMALCMGSGVSAVLVVLAKPPVPRIDLEASPRVRD